MNKVLNELSKIKKAHNIELNLIIDLNGDITIAEKYGDPLTKLSSKNFSDVEMYLKKLNYILNFVNTNCYMYYSRNLSRIFEMIVTEQYNKCFKRILNNDKYDHYKDFVKQFDYFDYLRKFNAK